MRTVLIKWEKIKNIFSHCVFFPICVYGFLENNTCTSQITKTSGVFLKFLIGPDWSWCHNGTNNNEETIHTFSRIQLN